MNILVTGCAGFIGNKVSEILLNDGNQIFGIDNLNSSYDISLKKYRLNNLNLNSNFNFFELDISNYKSIEKNIFNPSKNIRFDIIINLAARAGVRQSVENPWDYYESNTIGTLNLLELCKKWNIPKFILGRRFFSTFAKRHIGVRESYIPQMLQTCHSNSLDNLIGSKFLK